VSAGDGSQQQQRDTESCNGSRHCCHPSILHFFLQICLLI
jgi:hypothetical protein